MPRTARAFPLAVAVGLTLTMLGRALGAEPAAAQVASPALTPAGITVESPVTPGEVATLPALAVRNLGDTPLTYRMSALPIDDATPPRAAGWVGFTPEEFTVPPGGAEAVSVTLAVPDGEDDGTYRLHLRAAVLPGSGDGGLNLTVGVAVASVLEFQVGSGGSRGLSRYWPALVAAFLAGAAAYGLGSLADRYEVRLSVRRRRDGAGDQR